MRNQFDCPTPGVSGTILMVIVAVTLSACSQWKMPEALAGSWSGVQSVSTRYTDKEHKFCFIEDTLPVMITIRPDGKVSGFVGPSKFVNCKVDKNRGWLGKILHIATDFGIEGFLSGKLNMQDKQSVKKIAIPFNIEDSSMNGTIFLTNQAEMLPIVYTLHLKKIIE
jgi:hypothetical protein